MGISRDEVAYIAELARLESIHSGNDGLGAFLAVLDDSALERARGIDARRARGEPLGALAGVPVALKDNISVAGAPLTCGSKILEKFVPAYDATVVERLHAADAVIVGKTN